MLEKIQEAILSHNPEGFPVPSFAGERELGEEYRGVGVALWAFPEFTEKALCVPFSIPRGVIELYENESDDLASLYALSVVNSAIDEVESRRAKRN